MPRLAFTPAARCKEFPDDTVVNGDELYCLYCDHSLPYDKKSTILAHMESATHLRNKAIGSNTLPSPSKREQKTGRAVTPADRCREFPDDTVVNGDELFCLYCNHSLVHEKKSTVMAHMESAVHLRNKAIGTNTIPELGGFNKKEKTATKTAAHASDAAKQPSPEDYHPPDEVHISGPSITTRSGSSFVIKSRLLNRLRFSELEEGRHEIDFRDECTIFILPCFTADEGSKLGHLRFILENEAICLERTRKRVWRLAVDSSTVLTKLVQLGFSVASGSCDEGVYTWTLVDESSGEADFTDDGRSASEISVDYNRKRDAGIGRKRHSPTETRKRPKTSIRARDENTDLNEDQSFAFVARPQNFARRQPYRDSESDDNDDVATSLNEGEYDADREHAAHGKTVSFSRKIYANDPDFSLSARDRPTKKPFAGASAGARKRKVASLYPQSHRAGRIPLNKPARQNGSVTANNRNSPMNVTDDGTTVELGEFSTSFARNESSKLRTQPNDQSDSRLDPSVNLTHSDGGASYPGSTAARVLVETEPVNLTHVTSRDSSSNANPS